MAVANLAMLADAGEILSARQSNDIIARLLILVLGMALVIGIIVLVLVIHFLRTRRLSLQRSPRTILYFHREPKVQASIFPAPPRWLAIKSSHPQVVQTALGLHKPIRCSWEEGLSVANERKLFISPPVAGWILVLGSRLPDPADDVDKCFHLILDLSRKLGHVQFFSINRVLNHHSWVQAEQGVVLRAYAWAGRTLWNQGRVTRTEIDLGLKCFGYAELPPKSPFTQSDPAAFNIERVPLLAARWSIDPTMIDVRLLKETQGIAGELSQSKAH